MQTTTLEINNLIVNMLNNADEEELTIWFVEEETGELVKVNDFLNS